MSKTRMFDWKKLSAALAVVGAVAAGIWAMDGRYEREAQAQERTVEFRAQIASVKELYIRSEQRALRQQQFDLEREAQRRALTPLERQRLEQLRQELKDVDRDLNDARRQQTPQRTPP